MKNIRDIETALKVFEHSSNGHAQATEDGDYKKGNIYHGKILESISFLKNANAINSLLKLVNHPSVGVRLWAALYLLPTHETEAIAALEEIAKVPGIHSLSAETTLSEWKKGNIQM